MNIDRLELDARKAESLRAVAYRHPHFNRLQYYQYRVGLNRKLKIADIEWLNANTTGKYSVDFTIAPFNLSFEVEADALLFKLTWGGDLAIKEHIKY